MKAITAVLIVCAVLAGCATTYTHPYKKNQSEFDRDKSDCERVAARESARKGTRTCDEVDNCLVNRKGWQRSGNTVKLF